jgi:Abnormal spindle-like microcephaly-assoc'd, ASPM-SPD-2-Hydin
MIRRALLALLCLTAACGGSKSPTSPTPTPTQTRVIRLEANLAFGTIDIGSSFDAVLRIYSDGTAPLTVSGLSGPAGYTASWTSGTIQPGTSQAVTIRFAPTAAQTYNGTLTVQSDKTSGTDTTQVSGRGQGPPFKKTGTGANVFDIPTNVARIHITGDYGGSCENFIIKIAGRLIVNEILGSCSISIGRHYDGTHLITNGGVAEVTSSNGINWVFEEVR